MNYEEIEVAQGVDGQLTKHIKVDLGNGAFKSFPADPTNPEYAAFLESLNDDTNEAE
jgi:hypothetical protein